MSLAVSFLLVAVFVGGGYAQDSLDVRITTGGIPYYTALFYVIVAVLIPISWVAYGVSFGLGCFLTPKYSPLTQKRIGQIARADEQEKAAYDFYVKNYDKPFTEGRARYVYSDGSTAMEDTATAQLGEGVGQFAQFCGSQFRQGLVLSDKVELINRSEFIGATFVWIVSALFRLIAIVPAITHSTDDEIYAFVVFGILNLAACTGCICGPLAGLVACIRGIVHYRTVGAFSRSCMICDTIWSFLSLVGLIALGFAYGYVIAILAGFYGIAVHIALTVISCVVGKAVWPRKVKVWYKENSRPMDLEVDETLHPGLTRHPSWAEDDVSALASDATSRASQSDLARQGSWTSASDLHASLPPPEPRPASLGHQQIARQLSFGAASSAQLQHEQLQVMPQAYPQHQLQPQQLQVMPQQYQPQQLQVMSPQQLQRSPQQLQVMSPQQLQRSPQQVMVVQPQFVVQGGRQYWLYPQQMVPVQSVGTAARPPQAAAASQSDSPSAVSPSADSPSADSPSADSPSVAEEPLGNDSVDGGSVDGGSNV